MSAAPLVPAVLLYYERCGVLQWYNTTAFKDDCSPVADAAEALRADRAACIVAADLPALLATLGVTAGETAGETGELS